MSSALIYEPKKVVTNKIETAVTAILEIQFVITQPYYGYTRL